MKLNKINILYLGSFFMSFSYGVLLTLPLFFSKYLSLPISFSGGVISMGIFGVFPAIFLLPRLYNYIANARLISLGAFVYSLGILVIIQGNVHLYYMAGVLFGVGWGVVYTLGPVIISQLSSDKNRANNFSYISAFNMLGAGLSPVLVQYLDVNNISMYYIYYSALVLSLLACILFLYCKSTAIEENTNVVSVTNSFLGRVISSSAVIPMVMVFLGACVFSSMMNFQSLIADSKGLNFSYFYISYTLSVIFCRFALTKFVNSFNKELMMAILLFTMTLSLFLMRFAESNYFYILPSALLGLSYGLVYPLIQNASVKNAKTEEQRKKNLTFFSLFYFIGVYAFPYFFSLIVVNFGYGISLDLLTFISAIEIIFSLWLFRISLKTFSK